MLTADMEFSHRFAMFRDGTVQVSRVLLTPLKGAGPHLRFLPTKDSE